MMPVIACMLILGGLGGVSNWIIAPMKGLLVAAKEGDMPLWLQRTNTHQAPVVLLIGQALIVTVLSACFLFLPSVNGSYWLLTALAAQLYMLMYILMFAAGIKLRFTEPHQHRAFTIPWGKMGMVLVAGLGMLGSAITLGVSFLPPEGIDVGNVFYYEMLLIAGLFCMCSPPLIYSYWQERKEKIALQGQITQ
jgi:amino acid transporter